MNWYKARYMTSSSLSKWRYFIVPDAYKKGDSLVKYIETSVNAPTWSEHYHHVEYKKVKIADIPREILDYGIRHTEDSILIEKAYLKNLKEEAKKCRVVSITQKCKYCKGKRVLKIREKSEPCFSCKDGTEKGYDIY